MSIHNADSALDIDFISRNVMCDNVFATKVAIALELSGADNCIVSNSNFSQTRSSPNETKAFIYAEKACNCWLQNTRAYYKGKHRVTNKYQKGGFLSDIFKDKRHRRMFIGPDFDIPNHWFKFTGCEMESAYNAWETYFNEGFNAVEEDVAYLLKSQYGEFWDNCKFEMNSNQVFLGLYCINDIPDGITLRNSFFAHKTVASQQPFMFCCEPEYKKNGCTVCKNCLFDEHNKLFPCVRLENDVFNNFGNASEWGKSYIYAVGENVPSVDEAIRLSNSYFFNCYRNNETSFVQLEA